MYTCKKYIYYIYIYIIVERERERRMGISGQSKARAHTEERNLSLTRILNGCAETRTVGTQLDDSSPHSPSNSTSSPVSLG